MALEKPNQGNKNDYYLGKIDIATMFNSLTKFEKIKYFTENIDNLSFEQIAKIYNETPDFAFIINNETLDEYIELREEFQNIEITDLEDNDKHVTFSTKNNLEEEQDQEEYFVSDELIEKINALSKKVIAVGFIGNSMIEGCFLRDSLIAYKIEKDTKLCSLREFLNNCDIEDRTKARFLKKAFFSKVITETDDIIKEAAPIKNPEEKRFVFSLFIQSNKEKTTIPELCEMLNSLKNEDQMLLLYFQAFESKKLEVGLNDLDYLPSLKKEGYQEKLFKTIKNLSGLPKEQLDEIEEKFIAKGKDNQQSSPSSIVEESKFEPQFQKSQFKG